MSVGDQIAESDFGQGNNGKVNSIQVAPILDQMKDIRGREQEKTTSKHKVTNLKKVEFARASDF